MKTKPFGLLGITAFAIAACCCRLCDLQPGGFLCIIFSPLLLAVWFVGRRIPGMLRWFAPYLLPLCLLPLVFFVVQHFSYLPAVALDGKTTQVHGLVDDIPQKTGNVYTFTLKTDKIDLEGAPQHMNLKMYSLIAPQAGNTYEGTVTLAVPQGSYNFDLQTYCKSKGIYLMGSNYDFATVSVTTGHGLQKAILSMRQAMQNAIDSIFNQKDAGIARALLVGDKSGVDDNTYIEYQSAGVAYLLAVAGLHTAILAFALYGLLKLLRVKEKTSAVLTSGFLLFYMALVGFMPSVVRAGIMLICTLLFKAFFKEISTLGALGIAIALMLFISPFSADDVSLQLSFFASLGICLCAGAIDRMVQTLTDKCPAKLQKPIRYILSGIAISFVSTVFVLPVSLLEFPTVSVVSIFSSAILVPLVTVILPLLAVCILLYCFGLGGAVIVSIDSVCAVLIRLMDTITHWFSGLPFAVVPTGYRLLSTAMFVCALLFILCMISANFRKYTPICLSLCALLVCSSLAVSAWQNHNAVFLADFSDKDGSCLVLKNGDNYTAIGGSSAFQAASAASYLRSLGAKKINLLLLSASDKHYGDTDVWAECGLQTPDIAKAKAGDHYTMSLGAYGNLQITFTDAGFSVQIENDGEKTLLTAGKAEQSDESVNTFIALDTDTSVANPCDTAYCFHLMQSGNAKTEWQLADGAVTIFKINESSMTRIGGVV